MTEIYHFQPTMNLDVKSQINLVLIKVSFLYC